VPAHTQRSAKAPRPGPVSRREARSARAGLAAGALSRPDQRALRRVSRARDRAVRQRNLRLRRAGLAAAGAIGAMAVLAAAFAFFPAISAARGQGTPGTFIVGREVCIRGCVWTGAFESAGGQLTPGVAYEGNLAPGTAPGSRVPAIYPGGPRVAFPPHGSYLWLEDVLLILVIGAAIGLGLWISPIRLFRPRDRSDGVRSR
jgi:hypothetical protein